MKLQRMTNRQAKIRYCTTEKILNTCTVKELAASAILRTALLTSPLPILHGMAHKIKTFQGLNFW